MRPPIDNGTVLIIGAAGGIGRELARLLSPRVRTLVLVARDVDDLGALREELLARNPTLGLMIRACRLDDPRAVDALFDHLERNYVRVDVLINNADYASSGMYAEERWKRIEELVQANVLAPAMITHRLLRPMLERGRGGILTVGSGAARLFLPGAVAFAATQRFLDGFSESLRLELKAAGIPVTFVAAGPLALEPRLESEVTPFFELSLRQCAREALEGFERGEALVYPGLGHRWVMRLLRFLPRSFKRGLGRLALGGLKRTLLLNPSRPETNAPPQPVLLARGEPSSAR
ncbi:SDR family NAD(P)-dependent oxidoreductase [Corallococcus carmarthensis]|uniref:SDR family NAD(P)-dependent oxidoreductase n=1 Tax=Corallococcus carmarthensis TaxID=2316728 RepID=A0A3A8JQQ7_9BACT|nr:SDR family NAD(P)-dependent oxidoreductase [Corallococcus carmarthensis]NOK19966.1 SDR family NAD(P)-dependent oxidoreductase [Corallococcus carmarthensis]RKG97308.1 SDR family NAD(P)-dependent oxidoreductase [Corallococcus carmarthensis]